VSAYEYVDVFTQKIRRIFLEIFGGGEIFDAQQGSILRNKKPRRSAIAKYRFMINS